MPVSPFRSLSLSLLALPTALLAAQGLPTSYPPLSSPPKLMVAIAVDQLRPDYLVRWEKEFPGGLGRLVREGVFHIHAEQDHGVTETAPGHSTMMTGRVPGHTGIIGNDLGVPDPLFPLVGAPAGTATATLASRGASPRRFQGTTLFDWMLAHDPDTRVLSVSRKDRGAILPIGRARVPVYWHYNGHFVTSRWFADSLPTWVQGWNARTPVNHLAGTAWNLFRDPATYPEADDRPFEYGGGPHRFPYPLPTDPAAVGAVLENFPVMDSLILDLAITGLQALRLGQRNGTDMLAISLSTNDAIGHRYGPGSRELHDHLLHLDHWLGRFFDSLATFVPLDQVVISLTADHGVSEYPEAGPDGGRLSLSTITRALNRWALDRWRIALDARTQSGLLLADVDALRARGVDVDSLADRWADSARRITGVRHVYTPRTLAAGRADDPEVIRWRRQLPPGTGWLLGVVVEEGYMFGTSRTSTNHGTTNLLDRRVPIIIRAPGIPGVQTTARARTIDLAPTLAALLGIVPTEPVDGTPLPALFQRR